MTYSEDGVHFLVMRDKPSDERKCTQAGPDEVRKPEDDECKDGEIRKELVPGHHPAIGRRAVLWFMQGTKENRGSECRGPDKCAGIDQPSACKAGEPESAHIISRFSPARVEKAQYPSICVVRRYRKENPVP